MCVTQNVTFGNFTMLKQNWGDSRTSHPSCSTIKLNFQMHFYVHDQKDQMLFMIQMLCISETSFIQCVWILWTHLKREKSDWCLVLCTALQSFKYETLCHLENTCLPCLLGLSFSPLFSVRFGDVTIDVEISRDLGYCQLNAIQLGSQNDLATKTRVLLQHGGQIQHVVLPLEVKRCYKAHEMHSICIWKDGLNSV